MRDAATQVLRVGAWAALACGAIGFFLLALEGRYAYALAAAFSGSVTWAACTALAIVADDVPKM